MRRVAILGSTGSVGRQALEVIAAEPDLFRVCALAANKSVELLAEQANRFRPAILSAGSVGARDRLSALLEYQPRVVAHGSDGLAAVALESNADVLLAATDGMSALQAVAASIERGMQIALANKELMV
ncbi:MAG: 1-deoxy-D-xylulose-5-phosphate reductoisomerase, partial [Candidatus Eremiobacteraeota bacterium]|nr:1-deoxy-D-xylulose-5-phosphate reductoisomerase [Candidatus Eremiobacteraeota bacterium]